MKGLEHTGGSKRERGRKEGNGGEREREWAEMGFKQEKIEGMVILRRGGKGETKYRGKLIESKERK